MSLRNFISIATCSFLVACSATNTPPSLPKYDPATASLAEAATSVSSSLVDLAAAEQAEHAPIAKPPSPKSYGMGMIASIDWSGPIGPLLERISEATNYKIKTLGPAPAIPILVTVHAQGKAIGNILRDAGYQCGDRASIVVFPEIREIDLRYKGN